jgi:hypothetical protein
MHLGLKTRRLKPLSSFLGVVVVSVVVTGIAVMVVCLCRPSIVVVVVVVPYESISK